jgi:hypothetical protein
MPKTYTPIASQSVTNTSTGTITFSSIPQTYTDLVVVSNLGMVTASRLYLRFNGITTNTYSDRYITGTGGAFAGSDINGNAMTVGGAWNGFSTSLDASNVINIMDYKNTTTFKSLIARTANNKTGSGSVDALSGLWSNTSAITSVSLIGGSNFLAGSTFTLYGILRA